MLQDAIDPSEQLSIEGISSPIAAEILHFCDDGDLFPDPLRTSDLSSCSAATAVDANGTTSTTGLCCYDDGTFATDFPPFHPMDAATLSALLDSDHPLDTDHNAANYSSPPPPPPPPSMYTPYLGEQPDQFDQIMLSGYSSYSPEPVGPLPHQQQVCPLPPVVYEEDCLPPLPVGYMDPSPSTSSSFVDPCGLGGFYGGGGGGGMGVLLCGGGGEGQVGFFGGMMVGLDSGMGPPPTELVEYQRLAGDSEGIVGMYGPESMHSVYSSGDLQVIADGHHLLGGGGASPAPLPTSDISALDESTFKVGRLSNEERKEKIHRYMKKRNERNFSKKIKYACRKTLADSRPRVRGRFAKNDEFGGEAAARPSSSHHEYDDEEVVVKEEDMLDSSDILAHISGVNSFKYNYTLESWI